MNAAALAIGRGLRRTAFVLAAVLAALGVGLGLVAALGVPVADAAGAFAQGAFGSPYGIAMSVNRAIAFALVGLGFVFANRASLVNVGAEGQICLGGIAATAVALNPGVAALPLGLAYLLPLLASFLAGGAWGGLAGWMKARTGASEVITTLLLSFIGTWLLYWTVQSPALLRQPMTSSATLPESAEIPPSTWLPLLTGDYSFPLHLGLPITMAVALIIAVTTTFTLFGLKLRIVGLNPVAAARSGLSAPAISFVALAVAGGLGGLAGGIMLLGEQQVLRSGFSSGYGFDGLAAGLLARGSVPGVIAAALFLGFLRSGGISMEMVTGVPSALVAIVQGLVIIAIAGSAGFIAAKRR